MRHRVRTRRLGVTTPHRKAMMRNMVTSLLEHGRIVTTITRAKELRRLADRMITLGKQGNLHARRQALSVIRDKRVVARLFDEWAGKFSDRNGGYTRIVRMGPRRGDATMMAVIELAVDSLKPSSRRSKKVETSAAPESVIPTATAASTEPETTDVDVAAVESDSVEDTSAETAYVEAAGEQTQAESQADEADTEESVDETSEEEAGTDEPDAETAEADAGDASKDHSAELADNKA